MLHIILQAEFRTMRTQFILKSLILGAAFVALGLSASAARAADETLQPVGGTWAVSQMSGKSAKSSPYCAMARRFSNGSIVTFARNANEETSIALDLPRGTFTPGQSYNLMFDAGSGETRTYEIKPVSERGVVVRMGSDKPFFGALEKSNHLGVGVNGKVFVYAMPDIADGIGNLAACLEPKVETASTATPPVPAMDQDAVVKNAPVKLADKKEDGVGLKASSADLQKTDIESQSVREENIRLKTALEKERRSYEERLMALDKDSSPAVEMSEKLALLEIENARLRAGDSGGGVAAAPKSDAKSSREIETLKAEMQALQKEAAAAKAERDALKLAAETPKPPVEKPVEKPAVVPAIDPEAERMREQLSTADQKIRALEGQLQAAQAQPKTQPAPDNTAQLAAYERRVQDLEQKLASAANAVAPAVGVASVAPRAPAPARAQVDVAAKPAILSTSNFEDMFKRAGVAVPGGVKPVSGMPDGQTVYRWTMDGLSGSAEQRAMASGDQFDRMVQDYIAKTKSRCTTGQFASVPALVDTQGVDQFLSYEIVCVNSNGGGASAALVFRGKPGVFTAIAFESTPEFMDRAMDARDRMVNVLKSM